MSELDTFPGFQLLGQATEEGSQPKHERLRDFVASQIESGRLAAGTLLPSEHRIAEMWQVARSTVRQAMSTLERDGLVRRVHGKGTYIHEQARQRLKRGQDIFALILPETETGFYPSLQKSFEAAAAEIHSQVIVCNSNNEVDRQGNIILQLIDHRVAGVAIVPTTNPPTPSFHIRQLQQHGIPVVCCSRSVEGAFAPLLAIPFEEVGKMAGEALRSHGHQHVAFISGTLTEAVKRMLRGFQSALGNSSKIQFLHGTSGSPNVADHEAEVAAQLDQLLAETPRPTAIFATFDTFAELLFVLLSQRGIRVPEDISIVGFGGTRRTGALISRLTSVSLDEHELGQQAVELLNRMRNGTMSLDTVEQNLISIRLSEGQTLQAPTGEKKGHPIGH